MNVVKEDIGPSHLYYDISCNFIIINMWNISEEYSDPRFCKKQKYLGKTRTVTSYTKWSNSKMLKSKNKIISFHFSFKPVVCLSRENGMKRYSLLQRLYDSATEIANQDLLSDLIVTHFVFCILTRNKTSFCTDIMLQDTGCL